MTLWGRSSGVRKMELRPFYTFTTVSYNNEAFRTMLMKKIRYRWIMCVLIGLLISVVVGGMQYWFGRVEMDE